MHRFCLSLLILMCAVGLAQQPAETSGGLSPKAGTASENLYTNLYFGMNYHIPRDWNVTFVANEGECSPTCVLLDLRPKGYPKVKRTLTFTAESLASNHGGQVLMASTQLEEAGVKKVGPARAVEIAGRQFMRTDFSSPNAGLYQVILGLNANKYALVLELSAESRAQAEIMVGELGKALSFVRGS
jgi:hypothetical protein